MCSPPLEALIERWCSPAFFLTWTYPIIRLATDTVASFPPTEISLSCKTSTRLSISLVLVSQLTEISVGGQLAKFGERIARNGEKWHVQVETSKKRWIFHESAAFILENWLC